MAYHPNDWKEKPALQQPSYLEESVLKEVTAQLAAHASLVVPNEIESLKQQLAEVQQGNRFLLQGGDCAEAFSECVSQRVTKKIALLEKVGACLEETFAVPVTCVGRMAGQYAKPRSVSFEQQGEQRLPSYQGDGINGHAFDAARLADPMRMLQAYECSAVTMSALQASDCYTSHEAMLLPYEAALTRQSDGKWYNVGTHFPWLGIRTGASDGAHVAYLAGIENPVGIKIGPNQTVGWLKQVIAKLNPRNEMGKIMLIHRLGSQHIESHLPPLLEMIKAEEFNVVWCCDPMHGNTKVTECGIKTRFLVDIEAELSQAFHLHKQCGAPLGALHFEMTPDVVTECVGGNVSKQDLAKNYTSLCDPRLNAEQVMMLLQSLRGAA